MREYAKISPQFWIGETGRAIKQEGLEAQLVAFYLLTNPHATMLGIYYLPITFIAHETGITLEGASKALRSLCKVGFCSYDSASEYVWVHEMAFSQIGPQLKPGDNRIKSVNETYLNLPKLPFLQAFYNKYGCAFSLQEPPTIASPSEGPSKPLQSQEQEKEQEKEQKQEKAAGDAQARTTSSPAATTNIDYAIPPVITIPLHDKTEFSVSQVLCDEWQALYPAVDVLQALRNIRGWNLANPKNRKTRSGILKHITQWLAKEQNNTRHYFSVKTLGGNANTNHNLAVAESWLCNNTSLVVEKELMS
jgi:hypothetical protein